MQEGGEDGAGSGDILGFFLFRTLAAVAVGGSDGYDEDVTVVAMASSYNW